MWPEDYYREMDGADRKKLLDEALANSGEESAEDKLRLKLWQARYAPDEKGKAGKKNAAKPGEIDYFVKAWMDLSLIANNDSPFGKNRMIRDVRKGAGVLLLDQYAQEPLRSVLDQEYSHLLHLLIHLYLNDDLFTHRFLGLGKRSADDLQRKIQDRLITVTRYLPARSGLTDLFEPLERAATAAFAERFNGASL